MKEERELLLREVHLSSERILQGFVFRDYLKELSRKLAVHEVSCIQKVSCRNSAGTFS